MSDKFQFKTVWGALLFLVSLSIVLSTILGSIGFMLKNKPIWNNTLFKIGEIGAAWRGELPIETDSILPFIDPIDDNSDIINTTDSRPLSPKSEPELP